MARQRMTATPPASRRARARAKARNAFRSRFTCACCPGKEFRGHKALNAHHLARHGGYWGGAKAQGMGRKIGKEADAMRKHARGWLEAHGHVDRMGRRTARARSRPQAPGRGHMSLRTLRAQARHGRDHDKADALAGRAQRAAGRGRADRHLDLLHRAANLRNRHPVRPARQAPAPRPAPARAPRAAQNGHAPTAPRMPPRPSGRLAPARTRAGSNGGGGR